MDFHRFSFLRSPVWGRRGLSAACASATMLAMIATPDASARTITVMSSTYGQNCGAAQGNATADLALRCNGRDTCEYKVDGLANRASASSCHADLVAQWRCTDTEMHTAALSAVTRPDDTLVLSCVWQTGPGH
ncbi:Lipoprotein [Pararobbsia alpina]